MFVNVLMLSWNNSSASLLGKGLDHHPSRIANNKKDIEILKPRTAYRTPLLIYNGQWPCLNFKVHRLECKAKWLIGTKWLASFKGISYKTIANKTMGLNKMHKSNSIKSMVQFNHVIFRNKRNNYQTIMAPSLSFHLLALSQAWMAAFMVITLAQSS